MKEIRDYENIDRTSSEGDILLARYEERYCIYVRTKKTWIFITEDKSEGEEVNIKTGMDIGLGGWNSSWTFNLIKLEKNE